LTRQVIELHMPGIERQSCDCKEVIEKKDLGIELGTDYK
jgi:hypothetical protein